jgi:hypothetical protein
MATWRRKLVEYEADLYKVPLPKFFLFRVPKGELELKRYDDGETQLEVEFFGVPVPDGSVASVVMDGQIACQVEVRRGRARLKLSSTEGYVFPEVRDGSVGEIQYNGEPLLRGTFRPD